MFFDLRQVPFIILLMLLTLLVVWKIQEKNVTRYFGIHHTEQSRR